MLLKSQLYWAGHVSRMGGHHLPKIALYGELSTGHCNRGALKKHYKNSLKKTLSTCQLITISGQHLLLIMMLVAASFTRLSPPLKTPTGPTSWRNAAGGRSGEPQQPYQTRPLTAVAVVGLSWTTSFMNLVREV